MRSREAGARALAAGCSDVFFLKGGIDDVVGDSSAKDDEDEKDES